MKILLVEDNPELTQNIVEYLEQQGLRCEAVTSRFEAEDRLLAYAYDCLLLDLMLPDGNGLQLLEWLKSNAIPLPVLIISAKNALDDRLRGLDLGADDYLPKPFHLAELLARLRAIYRRAKLGGKDELVFGEILIRIQSLEVFVHQTLLDLTKKEFDLLVFLLVNKNKVLSKQSIANHLWGDYTDNLANFDFVYQHIKNLRKKITAAGGKDYLSTVYGLGYKFDEYAQ
ncbi:response regulator transcription factor [Algoriphagus confluentis]|uniref:Response regulator transcription factor n=1 Tax=Algoriphagus confluentis TaxID=1697556 RepID=A0ABQ6PQR1_9BACT|nr:response regulator transcription factor [Algoriphagus confluentis]